ncbi:MAG: ABC transporter substrate-binding protein [Candidatus Omnitrophota bacterium]
MRKTWIVGMVACIGLSVSVASASDGKDSKVKIGVSPVVSSSGIFLAYEKGYFKKEGIEADLTYFKGSGAPMTALLGNGSLDVGAGNISAGLWNAINSGLNIKLVADKGSVSKACDYIGLLVRKDHVDSKRYQRFGDLKGFKMAVTAFGVSQQIAADKFLKTAGLSVNDVVFEKMDYAAMNVALGNKALDATIQLEPYLTEAESKGIAVKVAGVNEVYPGQQSAAILYSFPFITGRPDLAEKFMIAYLKGVRDYYDAFIKGKNKEEAIFLLKKHVKIEANDIWSNMIPAGINPDGYLNKESLAEDTQWYREHGYLDVPCDIEKAVDHTFVEKALARLGKFE